MYQRKYKSGYKSKLAMEKRKKAVRRGRSYKPSNYDNLYKYGKMSLPYLAQGLSYVKGLLNVEYKFIDSLVQSSTVSSVATVAYLSGTAEGDTNAQRDGNSILCKSIYVYLSFTKHATPTTTMIRAILLIDHNNQGAAPATLDILDENNVNAMLNKTNGERFTILRDERYALDVAQDNIIVDKWYLKPECHIKYGGTSGAVGDARDQAIFLYLLSDQPSNAPGYAYNSRIRFIDN